MDFYSEEQTILQIMPLWDGSKNIRPVQLEMLYLVVLLPTVQTLHMIHYVIIGKYSMNNTERQVITMML